MGCMGALGAAKPTHTTKQDTKGAN
jgi:hypothetical protein